jgi:hypothetical protein
MSFLSMFPSSAVDTPGERSDPPGSADNRDPGANLFPGRFLMRHQAAVRVFNGLPRRS